MWSHSQISHTVTAAGLIALLGIVHAPTRRQGGQEVTIGGTEYAFLGVPKTLAPGPTTFSFENRGKVQHMMVIARLRDGVTPDSLLHYRGAVRDSLIEGGEGALVAAPGEAAVDHLLIPLAPGATYVLFCLSRNGPQQPPHMALGMFASFQVK